MIELKIGTCACGVGEIEVGRDVGHVVVVIGVIAILFVIVSIGIGCD